MPTRIQRKRTKGWKAPQGAVYVGRPTRWGNPARVVYNRQTRGWHVEHDHGGNVGTWPTAEAARQFAVQVYLAWLGGHPELADSARKELRGRDLMCWCPLPEPGQPDHCHAAVLLRLANAA